MKIKGKVKYKPSKLWKKFKPYILPLFTFGGPIIALTSLLFWFQMCIIIYPERNLLNIYDDEETTEHRQLRPGGKGGGGSSSSNDGEYEPSYDYNALYEGILDYIEDYNKREIYNA